MIVWVSEYQYVCLVVENCSRQKHHLWLDIWAEQDQMSIMSLPDFLVNVTSNK